MKASLTSCILLSTLCGAVCAQTVDTAINSSDGKFIIAERGPHHREWTQFSYHTNQDGTVRIRSKSFTQLETGMHVLRDGKYIESSEEITLTADGAEARNTQHQVTFASNLAAARTIGSISVITPDGKSLRSQILGLSYLDEESGKSVLIAEVKDCYGSIIGSNQVLYEDAFTDFHADVEYTVTKAGFSQNVILRERPPAPEVYGLNPKTTRMQVLTEFISPPQPSLVPTSSDVSDGVSIPDTTVDFGAMKIGRGRAFSVGQSPEGTGIPVSKSWEQMEGRDILIEEVAWPAILQECETLPAMEGGALKPSGDSVRHVVSHQRLLPAARMAAGQDRKAMQLAQYHEPGRGLIIDFDLVNGATNFTFQADKTYYVSGAVTLYGTTSLEGGSVIKLAPTNSPAITIPTSGTLNLQTGPYRMAVITCRDDNSIGETIPGSTGSPQRAPGTAINSQASLTLKYLRLTKVQTGINCGANFNAWHCQFVDCGTAVALGIDAHLYNVLFTGCGTNVLFAGSSCGPTCSPSIVAEHVTTDNVSTFMRMNGSWTANGGLTLRNSLLTSVGTLTSGWTTTVSTNASVIASSGTGTYAPAVGGGSYYLISSSTNRNAGTTGIDATLLNDLKKKTTYPPIVYAQAGITNLTLSPQAQRDSDGPDLGFHYEPIDYALGWVYAYGTLTVNPGTVLATFATNASAYGLGIGPGATFQCQGTPNQPNWIVSYNTVQEQPGSGWAKPTSSLIDSLAGAETAIRCRFTSWSSLAQDVIHFNGLNTVPVSFQDCEFHGGQLVSAWPAVNLTNCLLERVNADLELQDSHIPAICNNLVWRGTFGLYSANTTLVIRDNLFDKPAIPDWIGAFGNTYAGGFNAYITNSNRIYPTNATDKILTNSPSYQTGPLGNYYQLTNSGLVNLDTNLWATNVGMYHYTVSTNLVSGLQVKEGGTRLDVGYHYVAGDANGNPTDTDLDTVADYLEDANGNGSFDAGETNWQGYNSPNGLTSGNGLQVFTPLKP